MRILLFLHFFTNETKKIFISFWLFLQWFNFALEFYYMEEIKDFKDKNDLEIVFSKAVKAGKRIYYFDVKKNRRGELFLAITESKKKVGDDDSQVSFEKHKIFLYKEDFEKFANGLSEVTSFIDRVNKENGIERRQSED